MGGVENEHIEPLLRIKQILAIIPVHRETLRRWRRTGFFPEGQKLSDGVLVWRQSVVLEFVCTHLR